MDISTNVQNVAGLHLTAPRQLYHDDGRSFWIRRLVAHDGHGNAHHVALYAATEAALLTEDEAREAADRDADAADHEAEEARRVHEERHGQGCLGAQGVLNGAAGRACEVNEGPPPF